MKTTSARLALLFREAGLIDETHWKASAEKKRPGEGKQLGAILKSDALSLQTYRDLYTKLAFSRQQDQEIEKVLSEAVHIPTREIIHILKANKTKLKALGLLLLDEHLGPAERIKAFFSERPKITASDYELFLAEGLLTPEIISKLVANPASQLSHKNRLRLARDILVFNNMVSRTDWDAAVGQSEDKGKQLRDVLNAKGLLESNALVKAVDEGLYFASIELGDITVREELLELFPSQFIRQQLILPISKKQNTLSIVTADPLNLALINVLALLTGYNIYPIFAPQSEIIRKINILLPSLKEAEARAAGAPKAPEPATPTTPREIKVEGIDALVDNRSTVQLVSSIIERAIATRATDIHIEPQESALRVRYRIDGSLHNIMPIPLEMQLPVISRIKVLANMNVTERRRPQDGHFFLQVGKNNYDFRVSTLPTHLGEKVVIRILSEATVLTGLSELGLEKDQQTLMERIIRKPYGMILVSGPTGSGKTSTLYSALNAVNDENRNIVTIEDPVEYELEGINQVQVDYNIDLTFATLLRSTLRQDPDIILVGEIRDQETAHIAIRAALTGHLVFSTLHTNTSVGAIPALIHMGVQTYMLSSALIAIMAQRLVKKICPKCKISYVPPKGILKDLGISDGSKKRMYRGRGCDHCLNTGYWGRTGIFEILVVDETIKRLVMENASEEALMKTAIANKMTTLAQSGINKIYGGITTAEEVMETIFLL
jgi:type IV pilus assembly protein PilB